MARQFAGSLAIGICLVRDSFKVAMPLYLSVYFVVAMICISVSNIVGIEFGNLYYVYPQWLLFFEKESWLQVLIVLLLIAYNMYFDPYHNNFVLIRGKVKRKIILGQYKSTSTLSNAHNQHNLNASLISDATNSKSQVLIALTNVDNDFDA